MTEREPGEAPYVVSRIDAVHHTVEGSVIDFTVNSNLDEAVVTQVLSEIYGIPAEDIYGPSHSNNSARSLGRVMVGFRKWRSDWDPHAQKIDPNLN